MMTVPWNIHKPQASLTGQKDRVSSECYMGSDSRGWLVCFITGNKKNQKIKQLYFVQMGLLVLLFLNISTS